MRSVSQPKPEPSFTADDLLAALSGPVGGDGLTCQELAKALGVKGGWIGRRLRLLHEQGRIEARWAPRPTLHGVSRLTPVYKLKA